MSALMGGVDSSEPTVRTETLRLLRLADRNLPQLTLDSHLEAVRTGRGLPLPHDVNPSKSEKAAVAEGRAEAACRALEVAGVVSEGLTDEERGERLAETVATISSALRTGNPKHRVWLEGVQTVIADLNASPAVFRRAFLDALARHLASDPADPTAAVLVTTAAVEYPVGDASASIDALIAALPAAAPSVQELVVLALVPLLARLRDRSEATARVVAALKAVADDPGVIRHMAKRCAEVVLIVERDLVDAVVQRSKSRAVSSLRPGIN